MAMLLAGLLMPRPSTFELTTKLLDVAKMTMEKVAVTILRDNTYYATMWVKVWGRLHEGGAAQRRIQYRGACESPYFRDARTDGSSRRRNKKMVRRKSQH
jgi:Domain of unknown function (DUF151)